MNSVLRSLLIVTALSAFAALPASADEDLAFLGKWDCGVGTFTFTPTTYNNGSEDLAIQKIVQGKDGWTLMFANDYWITLSSFRGDEMGWFSSSGEELNCKRVN